MDAKDLEIARLKGQIEAYQDQLRSVSIELLRKQVKDLQDAAAAMETLLKKNQIEFGKFKAEVTERLAKASTAFVELREQVKETQNDTRP